MIVAMTGGCVSLVAPGQPMRIGQDRYRVEVLALEQFDDAEALSRFAVEGDATVEIEDGRLRVRRTDLEARQMATLWYRQELPDNVLIQYRASAVAPEHQNAANLNVIIHARESDGSPVKFTRSGRYAEYHSIPNYIITFTGGVQPGWSRVRRNPGFHILHESDIRTEVGREYAVTITIIDGRIRYYVNDELIHDVTDPEPHSGGWFALRTWSSDVWWDNLLIARIVR